MATKKASCFSSTFRRREKLRCGLFVSRSKFSFLHLVETGDASAYYCAASEVWEGKRPFREAPGLPSSQFEAAGIVPAPSARQPRPLPLKTGYFEIRDMVRCQFDSVSANACVRPSVLLRWRWRRRRKEKKQQKHYETYIYLHFFWKHPSFLRLR